MPNMAGWKIYQFNEAGKMGAFPWWRFVSLPEGNKGVLPLDSEVHF